MAARTDRKGTFHTTTLIAVALLLLILFVTVGYFFTLPEAAVTVQQNNALTTLEKRRAIWQGRKPTAFSYVVQRSCFCTPDVTAPYVVTDEYGFARGEYLSKPPGVQATEPTDILTIEQAFELVEKAITDAESVDVTYHPEFGFPTAITIDWIHQAADDEDAYTLTEFRVLIER